MGSYLPPEANTPYAGNGSINAIKTGHSPFVSPPFSGAVLPLTVLFCVQRLMAVENGGEGVYCNKLSASAVTYWKNTMLMLMVYFFCSRNNIYTFDNTVLQL